MLYYIFIQWTIILNNKVVKQLKKLSEKAVLVTQLLVEDLKDKGPYPGSHWPKYGKLHAKKHEDKHYCHLIKGNPTYVAYWKVLDKKIVC